MKKIIYLIAILFSTLLTSCSQPDVIDRWKTWVAINYTNESTDKELISQYMHERFQQDIDLTLAGDYSDDPTGGAEWAEFQIYFDIAQYLLKGNISEYKHSKSVYANFETFLEPHSLNKYYEYLLVEAGYDEDTADYYAQLASSNEDHIRNLATICADLKDSLLPIYENMVSVEDYWWVAEWSGDTFDAYQVIYNINNQKYILATIMERESGASELDVVASANSLLSLHNKIEFN